MADIAHVIDDEAVARMPKRKSIQRSIRRVRQKLQKNYPEPQRIEDINIPEEYKPLHLQIIQRTFFYMILLTMNS